MVTTKLNLSMTEPQVRQIYAKQGDTGRVLDITLDQTPEDGTLRILRPDGTEVTSEAVTGGEVESGGTFESLTEADVTELTVGIEPVQDLNGYDAPWVGGAGKNKYPVIISDDTWVASNANNSWSKDGDTVVVNCEGAQYRGAYSNSYNSEISKVIGTLSGTYTYSFDLKASVNCTARIGYEGGKGAKNISATTSWQRVTTTATFDGTKQAFIIYNMMTTALTLYVKNFQLELGSTATAWQPYSNICPITGHDEVRVTGVGKNLLDNTVRSGQTLTSNGVSCTINSDGSVAVSGTATERTVNAWFVGNYGLFKVKRFVAGTYTFTDFMPFYHYVDETILRSEPTSFSSRNATFTFTKDWWLDGVRCPAAEPGTEYNLTIYPQMEFGATATSFEPYRSNTYTTSLGQTVYGGTLDMVSGVLTVDKVKWIPTAVSVSSVTMTDGNAGYRFNNYSAFSGESLVDTSRLLDVTATFLKSGVANWVTPNAITLGSDGKSFFACLSPSIGISTVSAFNSWITTNGYYIVYPLATPQTYLLTPQQIMTLLGTNNVWASSGDIVSIKFTYGGLFSELPSEATEIVGKCYCDVEQNGVSSMPFTLNVKKNERES